MIFPNFRSPNLKWIVHTKIHHASLKSCDARQG
jgi:hypothetical protein